MKRFALTTALLMGIGIGGGALVSAQTAPAPKPAKPPAAHVHPGAPSGGPNAMCGGMGMGMMGGGMGMGMGMMGGGMGPMGMAAADTKVDVKNVDKGVTITFTSSDPARVARLQKMAEAMRLMHEANVP
jgi:hypothetical protein